MCLQETKTQDESFPREPFEALGYNVAVHGQKTFNGVAILSKLPFDEVTPRLPGDPEGRSCALHRGGHLDAGRRSAHRIDLSAQWQPTGNGQVSI